MGSIAAAATMYLVERRRQGDMHRQTMLRVSYTLRSLDTSFGDRPLAQFGPRAIERWIEQNQRLKASTRTTYLSQIREFCRWLRRRKMISGDPFEGVKLPRRPRPQPRPLPDADVARLLAATPDARARLIVHLQWGLGLRCVGVSNLRIEDIDTVAGVLIVREKRDAERRLPITPPIATALAAYLAEAPPATSGPLIRSMTNSTVGIGAARIGSLVAGWMSDAGVKQRPGDGRSAHALRHTCLTEVAEACGDAFIVAELAGWASISTAAHYVRRATTERVRSALEQRGNHENRIAGTRRGT